MHLKKIIKKHFFEHVDSSSDVSGEIDSICKWCSKNIIIKKSTSRNMLRRIHRKHALDAVKVVEKHGEKKGVGLSKS